MRIKKGVSKMKKEYEKPMIEVVVFKTEEVLSPSVPSVGGGVIELPDVEL